MSKDEQFEIDRLERWVADLQIGMYINCIYCGHRYGPSDAEIPADALRKHVAMCSKHPMAALIGQMQKAVLLLDQKGRIGRARTVLLEAIQKATA